MNAISMVFMNIQIVIIIVVVLLTIMITIFQGRIRASPSWHLACSLSSELAAAGGRSNQSCCYDLSA